MNNASFLRHCTFALTLSTLVLTSCGGSSDSSSSASSEDTISSTELTSPASGGSTEFKVQTDAASAVAGVMGDADLTLTTTSPIIVPGAEVGSEIRLVVPAGAVPAGTTITLTPITAILAEGRTWRVLAGAQFSPNGLQFVSPGTLTMTMPTTVAGQFSVISESGGLADKYALAQGLSEFSAQVHHFSSVAIVPDAVSNDDLPTVDDPKELRNLLLKQLEDSNSTSEFDEVPTSLIDALVDIGSDQLVDRTFGDYVANSIQEQLVEGLQEAAALCPKDEEKMKNAMKKAIDIGVDAGLELQGWTHDKVNGLFAECDRYTVTVEGRVSMSGQTGHIAQTVKSTIVVTGGSPLASFGEGILFSKFESPEDWDTALLDKVNAIRAENGAAPCTAHTIPGTVQVASLDTTSEEGLNYVDFNLWDAVHDWGGPFGCESLDGGWALFADTLTEIGKSNSFRVALEPKKGGWFGEIETQGSTPVGNGELVMKVAVVRTPGAHLTEPGGRGHAVGATYPYYDHYSWTIENHQVIETAWDSATNSTVVINLSADGSDGYSDLDQGWDGEWDLPIEDPYQEQSDGENSEYLDDDWWPIDEWPTDMQDSVEMEIPIDETSTTTPDDLYPGDTTGSEDTAPPDIEVVDE
jgi:hypothetical protein